MVGDSKYASTIIILLRIHIPTIIENEKVAWREGLGVGPWDECRFHTSSMYSSTLWDITSRLLYRNSSDAVWVPIFKLQITGRELFNTLTVFDFQCLFKLML